MAEACPPPKQGCDVSLTRKNCPWPRRLLRAHGHQPEHQRPKRADRRQPTHWIGPTAARNRERDPRNGQHTPARINFQKGRIVIRKAMHEPRIQMCRDRQARGCRSQRKAYKRESRGARSGVLVFCPTDPAPHQQDWDTQSGGNRNKPRYRREHSAPI
jgi:hypothetical protein